MRIGTIKAQGMYKSQVYVNIYWYQKSFKKKKGIVTVSTYNTMKMRGL